jgi:hypothetical protein
MPNPPITRSLLQGFEGRNISAICTEVGYVNNALNHCAHFVNHVLGFDHPLTCGGLANRPGAAANIRVHETFAQCPEVGEFANRPNTPCLAFTTLRGAVNLATRTMANTTRTPLTESFARTPTTSPVISRAPSSPFFSELSPSRRARSPRRS